MDSSQTMVNLHELDKVGTIELYLMNFGPDHALLFVSNKGIKNLAEMVNRKTCKWWTSINSKFYGMNDDFDDDAVMITEINTTTKLKYSKI